jgi:hypothetical protein
MSKKSRKRNRKILKALAVGLGAAALAKRGTAQGVSGADKAKFTSNAAYSPAPVTGTDYPGANKAVVADPAPVGTVYGGGIHRGKPPKGDIVKRMRINAINTAEGSPMIDNPYRAPVQPKGRLWSNYSKGGRVKGGGKAKRGLGRAFTKRKK